MSMLDRCKDCLGDDCKTPVCIFNNQSYTTEQKPIRDKEQERRKELIDQADKLINEGK